MLVISQFSMEIIVMDVSTGMVPTSRVGMTDPDRLSSDKFGTPRKVSGENELNIKFLIDGSTVY